MNDLSCRPKLFAVFWLTSPEVLIHQGTAWVLWGREPHGGLLPPLKLPRTLRLVHSGVREALAIKTSWCLETETFYFYDIRQEMWRSFSWGLKTRSRREDAYG